MIVEILSPEILKFLQEIEGLGFSLCLVGGATRDYLYNQKISNDLDFEIRPNVSLPLEKWPDYYERLLQFFSEKKLIFTKLPYLITRVSFKEKHFEFSSPRTEVNLPDNVTHHHFKATLDPNLTYEVSFKRRDFTINAIGLELSDKVVDPFKGIEDLKSGILKNISEDFFLDSVRFLRLIRFQLKFNTFHISDELISKMHLFNLSALSIHHFTEEVFKSNPADFINLFSAIITSKKLAIPESFQFWTKYIYPNQLKTKEDFLVFVFLKNENDGVLVSQFFSLGDKKLRDLKSFIHSDMAIQKMKGSDFIELYSHPVEIALKHEIFKDLKNVKEKSEWKIVFDIENDKKKRLLSIDDLNDTAMTPEEINLIPAQLRSYYPFYKIIKKKYQL